MKVAEAVSERDDRLEVGDGRSIMGYEGVGDGDAWLYESAGMSKQSSC